MLLCQSLLSCARQPVMWHRYGRRKLLSMPLDQEFRHHLHELMVETSDRLREELNSDKQKLVWEAQKRNNSAGINSTYPQMPGLLHAAMLVAALRVVNKLWISKRTRCH